MKLSPTLVKSYRDREEDTLLFGVRIGDMDRDEMLTTIAYLTEQLTKLRGAISKITHFKDSLK